MHICYDMYYLSYDKCTYPYHYDKCTYLMISALTIYRIYPGRRQYELYHFFERIIFFYVFRKSLLSLEEMSPIPTLKESLRINISPAADYLSCRDNFSDSAAQH